MADAYPITTLAQMSEIPEEALPRFLAELPAILATMRQLKAAAPDLAAQARANAPFWSRWMITPETTRLAIDKARDMKWVDDDRGTATVSLRVTRDGDPVFQQTERMRS